MQYLSLLGSLLFFLVIIYCWNRFVVVYMIKMVSKKSQSFTPTKVEKSSFEWISQREQTLIKALQLFFWLGGLAGILFLIINEVQK